MSNLRSFYIQDVSKLRPSIMFNPYMSMLLCSQIIKNMSIEDKKQNKKLECWNHPILFLKN